MKLLVKQWQNPDAICRMTSASAARRATEGEPSLDEGDTDDRDPGG
jgi:hypothetical protein